MTLAVGSSNIKSPAFIKRICCEELSITIILLLLLSTPAFSASFDCKKAASSVEKTVCSNPKLSQLDTNLAIYYHDAMTDLSPEGQKETKQYQKKWLKEIPQYCQARVKLKSVDNLAECLKDAYEDRVSQLLGILNKFPNRIFRNVHMMHWETIHSENDDPDYITKIEIIYPQIENPRDKNEKIWNTLISKKASDDFKSGGDDDTYTQYTVSFSNKHIISLQSEDVSYPNRAPHGYTGRYSFSWLIEANRKLRASDLFKHKTGWHKKLMALVSKELEEDKDETYVGAPYKIEPSALMNIVTSPDCWVILKGGLGIQFGEYELGFRSSPLIFIDWKDL